MLNRVLEWVEWVLAETFKLIVCISLVSILSGNFDDVLVGRLGGNWYYVSKVLHASFTILMALGAVVVVIK